MKPRERFIQAVKRNETDRVPNFVRFMGGVQTELSKIFGVSGTELEIRLGNDALMVQIGINAEYSHRVIAEGETYTSEWGVVYKRVHGFNQPLVHPLKESSLEGYQFPDPYKPERMTQIKQMVDKYHDEYAIIVDLSCTFFEAGFHLRGMENFVMDSYEDEDFVIEVMERLADYYGIIGKRAIEQGIDVIRIGDDVGVQTGLIIAPDRWRRIVKPAMARMIRLFKETNPDIIVKYHSCGDFSSIIPDIIELGVELIGTMQPCGQMDPVNLKKEFGNKVAFLGGLDVQQLLPNGTPEQVRQGVKKVIQSYAPGGGYVFMPAHYVNVDVPMVNIITMLEAVKDFGRFPINID